jgi:hypothetical protein
LAGPNDPVDALTPVVNITSAMQWSATVLTHFFEWDAAFPNSVPISIIFAPWEVIDSFSPLASIRLFNNSNSANFTEIIANITFDPLDPGRLCQTSPMTAEQLPALFGLEKNPEFCSILTTMFVVWYWVSLADFGQTYDPNTGAQSTNIFVNETLFERYNNFMNDVAYPSYPYLFGPNSTQISHLPLNESMLQNSPFPFTKNVHLFSTTTQRLHQLFRFGRSGRHIINTRRIQYLHFRCIIYSKRLDRKCKYQEETFKLTTTVVDSGDIEMNESPDPEGDSTETLLCRKIWQAH